jgi:membrane-associated protease RseP (regulator of RpoE activity)
VSRETRLLLLIALISVGALWILARFRFPDRPAEPNPVAPVLSQLALRSTLDDVAATIAELAPRIAAWIVVVDAPGVENAGRTLPALRLRDGLAVTWLRDAPTTWDGTVALAVPVEARDPASGLTVIRVAAADVPEPSIWVPRRVETPRYVVSADVSRYGASIRPVFLGALYPVASPLWDPAAIWAVPQGTALRAGTFLFTTEAALIGLVIEREGQPIIVPGETLVATANRLLLEGHRQAGRLGVDVQALNPTLAAVTGAPMGVVVTWVDPEAPANPLVRAGDVIETMDDYALETPDHWLERISRLQPGETVVLRVRRNQQVREVSVTVGQQTPPRSPELGLTMRGLPGTGAEVVRVLPGSTAARAGIAAGDIITSIGGIGVPGPAVVSRTFANSSDNQPLLVGIVRNGTRRILVLIKE